MNPLHLFRTNTDLRAEVTDLTRTLSAARRRITELLVQTFMDDATTELANLKSRLAWSEEKRRELEAKLAPFVRRARDPVTKRFVGVAHK